MKKNVVFAVSVAGILAFQSSCRQTDDASTSTGEPTMDRLIQANGNKQGESTHTLIPEQSEEWTYAEAEVNELVTEISILTQGVENASQIDQTRGEIDRLVAAVDIEELSVFERQILQQRIQFARRTAGKRFQDLMADSGTFSHPSELVKQQVRLSAWMSSRQLN